MNNQNNNFTFLPLSGRNTEFKKTKENEHEKNEAVGAVATGMFFEFLGHMTGIPGLGHMLEGAKATGEAFSKTIPGTNGSILVANTDPAQQIKPHLAFRGKKIEEEAHFRKKVEEKKKLTR